MKIPSKWHQINELHESELIRVFARISLGYGGCWVWGGKKRANGYGVYKSGGKEHTAHRRIYQVLVRILRDDEVCCHRCDNRDCLNPDHIFIGSRADNQRDMANKGRAAKGVHNGTAKLSESDILKIRSLAGSMNQREIALLFNVHQPHICKIIRRDIWRHI